MEFDGEMEVDQGGLGAGGKGFRRRRAQNQRYMDEAANAQGAAAQAVTAAILSSLGLLLVVTGRLTVPVHLNGVLQVRGAAVH